MTLCWSLIFIVLGSTYQGSHCNLLFGNIPIQFTKMTNQLLSIKTSDIGKTNSCPLQSFTSSYMTGSTVKIEKSFLPSIKLISNIAAQCGVRVYITSSFRKAGRTPSGAIVPPATHSNHYVGHAIDFNLDTPDGFCNSKCLQALKNSYAKRFVEAVKKSGLRWGGDFSVKDPVHIDDNLYLTNPTKWNLLFNQLQKAC